MKQHTILKTLAVAILATATLHLQAQGIYVNKKNGESIPYPAATFDKVTPEVFSNVQPAKVKGAVATLQYERIADMSTAREGHQIFPSGSGNGFVVVGGCDVNYKPLQTAEIYKNGEWKNISIGSAHAYGFSAVMNDGRVMVGGGRLSSANDGNYSKKTAIYDPSTETFTAGPDMTTGRMSCSAVAVGNTVYVNGNYLKGDDKTMDYFDGTSFKAVGTTYERYSPAMFASKSGLIWTWGVYDTSLNEAELYTNDEGNKGLLFNTYEPTPGKSHNFISTDLATNKPLTPSWEMRPSEYFYSDDSDAFYLFLTRDSNGKYLLKDIYESKDQAGTLNMSTYRLEIPTVFPGTQTALNYKGSVFVNNEKKEVYLIGYDENSASGVIYILSYSLANSYWTIAKAEGLACSVLGGAWCILPDGRLACTGGYGEDSAIKKCAYIFTPPVAGLSDATEGKGVNVWKTDGTHDSYTESELQNIITYEEDFDERITQEIPKEYLTKMSGFMPIYSGNTPPNIEGVYNMSPCVMVYDSNNSYEPGKLFTDVVIEMTDQNMTQNILTFREEYVDDDGSVTGSSSKTEAKIIGNGNDFTLFVITKTIETDGSWLNSASLYSGTKSGNGIKNLYEGFVVLDKYDPNNKKMKIGQFRIINDQDGFSDPTTWKVSQSATRMKDGSMEIHALPISTAEGPTGFKTTIDIKEEVRNTGQ
jgi:hypothetical protein